MPKIRILPEILANKIAAGEVVERPASIVKELLENAVDARAKHVVASIDGGGRKRIVVTDDGVGMEPDDMFLALERHATSKLASEADLFDIRSLGFRGEALPSIASVTNMTIESRVRELDVGQRITVHAGVIRNVEEISMQPGTRITASRLFHNTPVRLKFLKSPETEMGHITDMFIRTALPLSEIHFRLEVDGKPSLEFPSGASPRDRLYILWGQRLTERAVSFSSDTDEPRVSGYLVPPEESRTAPRHVYAYVNGRWVRDRLLHKGILDAYRPFLTKGRYPMALLFLDIDPAKVDVNVHPTKAEVRFTNPQSIYNLIVSNIKTALDAHIRSGFLPGNLPEVEPWQVGQKSGYGEQVGFKGASADFRNVGPSRRPLRVSEPVRPAPAAGLRFPETTTPHPAFPETQPIPFVKILGQLGKSYILCETREGLLIVDQHAAHERVTYERLKQDAAGTFVPRQTLLSPEVVELSPKDFTRIQNLRENLKAAGLELHPFGDRSVVVREVPALLKQVDVPALINDLLDHTAETSSPNETGMLDHVLIIMACHGSIRSGQTLSREEMETLIRDVLSLDSPLHCPHGRPVWKRITFTDLEKELKRR